MDPHRVNLPVGKAAKLTLIMEQEEGFFLPSNQIAVSVKGLPAGVEALTGASSYRLPGSPKPPVIKGADHHLPKVQTHQRGASFPGRHGAHPSARLDHGDRPARLSGAGSVPS